MSKKNYDYLFKLFLVGESCVGKSVLLERYIDNSYRGVGSLTIGPDYKLKDINYEGKKIRLQIMG